jgi:hypothetical protein
MSKHLCSGCCLASPPLFWPQQRHGLRPHSLSPTCITTTETGAPCRVPGSQRPKSSGSDAGHHKRVGAIQSIQWSTCDRSSLAGSESNLWVVLTPVRSSFATSTGGSHAGLQELRHAGHRFVMQGCAAREGRPALGAGADVQPYNRDPRCKHALPVWLPAAMGWVAAVAACPAACTPFWPLHRHPNIRVVINA